MKTNVLTLTNCKAVVRILFILLLPLFSYSQTFFGVSSSSADGTAQTGTTVSITPPGSMATGDLVVIYALFTSKKGALAISDMGGQSWTTESSGTDNASNLSYTIFWCRFNGTWSTTPSVTDGATASGPLSATMYVYRPTNPNNLWGIDKKADVSANAATTISIAGVTAAFPNTVTMAFWSSPATNTWGSLTNTTEWSKTSLDAQNRNTSQSYSAAYNIRSTAGAVASVAQTQSTSLKSLTSLIGWYEIAPPTNDLCSNAIPLNSGASCTASTSVTLNVATTYTATANACGTNNNDVWYSFVAKSPNPTITLTGAPTDARAQIMAGDCTGGFAAVGSCPSSTTTSASGLTVGATYYVRVYSTSNASGTFTICITDPVPANDNCNGAFALTSSTTCNPTSGNLYLSTTSATPSAPCASSVAYDVWYSFTAQTTNPTITLGAIGSDVTSARLQLFSGSCTGGLTSLFCGTTSIASSGLTIGSTYYVRVYSSTGPAPTSTANAGFTICVTDVPPPAPSNDDCTGAITLPTNGSCSKVWGTVAGSTGSGIVVSTGCTGASGYDVWYKFDAIATSTTITTADFGANFQNRRLQLFSGTCGALTAISCGTGNTLSPTTLTVGATYYIRLFSADATAPITNGDFSICLTTATSNIGPRFGNSYVNISKKSLGGVVQKGDTLEIRMTINHTSGTLYKMRYLDDVPTNTQMLAGTNDKISVITNEGVAIQNYTPAAGDDAATYIAAPPAGQRQIRMNLGFGTTVAPSPTLSVPTDNTETEITSATGQAIAGSHIPKGGGGLLFATSFRVVVTGNVGDVITLGAGKFIYRNVSTGGSDIILTANPYQILISDPMSLCANSTGVNMSQESGGTFGAGSNLNRNQDLAFPIPGYSFVKTSNTQAVGDGQYAIVKNMSPRSGTNRDADRNPTSTFSLPDQRAADYRMFNGFWDIDGDHTGTNNAVGNIPTGDGVSSGYMLMVNADFVASETYRQTLTNLCPNTYYEFSAWFRNICPNCGIDYVTGSNYTPRTPGVLPNLTFALDGLDRYNTGEISYLYQNGNSGGWVKKGFVFITGPTQTTATLSIRNNSQGGGGNDWAMDDITVATCLPSMTYTPTLNPTVCQFNPITISNKMQSYFSNYTHYKWQRSTDGGTTWADISGQSGSGSPTLVGGQWEYNTSYTIPPANTTLANNGDRYRQIVATTAANLNGSTCQATDGVSIISLNVLPDCTPLTTNLLSFSGKLLNDHAQLFWTTSKEAGELHFGIERSADGIHFTRIGTVNGYNNARAENNHYSFTDSSAFPGMAYYRIAMTDSRTAYSRTIQLGNKSEVFNVTVTTNPFDKHVSFNVVVDKYAKVQVLLLDATGNVVKEKAYTAYTGLNNFSLQHTDDLPPGIYILKVYNQEQSQSIKLIKK
ncbi:T9SS type A sorting domain-containing protein [Flavisolibacter tropicus]|uniref:T9SS-like galactose binding domain-containing protein n=1 Tax=Flavisolibacter tropicus TaxID=1492898 RepID=A0A172TYU6_9BACT|nr:T9SS type A sorting domain-containing protein [Flavisolibacter tropicus]ANE52281.1 hypothetical protein SY85_19115 [Flavisolibacter tropicus]